MLLLREDPLLYDDECELDEELGLEYEELDEELEREYEDDELVDEGLEYEEELGLE